ncbi:MAG: hypothetical protein QXP29_07180 [Candidatus Nezhaarchaeales archaeon]|uniref:hypothetical protein n=1 Tax=Thermofilum sp. TaxID=1961369 RepID=UPI00316A4318
MVDVESELDWLYMFLKQRIKMAHEKLEKSDDGDFVPLKQVDDMIANAIKLLELKLKYAGEEKPFEELRRLLAGEQSVEQSSRSDSE